MEKEGKQYVVYLNSKAKEEFSQILDYLIDQTNIDIADKFLDEFESILGRLISNPEVHGIIENNYRRALFRKFDYSIYYYIDLATMTVIIAAITHQKRHPDTWKY